VITTTTRPVCPFAVFAVAACATIGELSRIKPEVSATREQYFDELVGTSGLWCYPDSATNNKVCPSPVRLMLLSGAVLFHDSNTSPVNTMMAN
jgi:hypothetical protein